MAEGKLNLAAKIAKISAEIGAISKSGRNSEQGYFFIEYAVVAAEIRAKQEEVGIAIVPQIESYTSDEVRTAKGRAGFHYLLSMTFDVINTDNPEDRMQVKWVGEATDYGDKGVNKAITSAVKYFIMRLYNISEKGEKEADAETPEVSEVVSTKETRIMASKIDLNTVKARLDKIDDVAALEDYWRSLGNMTKKQAEFFQQFFARRKEQINGVE